MKPSVTLAYGGLSADARLPGWTAPFLVRLAERFRSAAAQGGPPVRLVRRDGGGLALVDAGDDPFGREFGTLERPAAPRLGPAADRLRARGP
jgi:hypothetical protein